MGSPITLTQLQEEKLINTLRRTLSRISPHAAEGFLIQECLRFLGAKETPLPEPVNPEDCCWCGGNYWCAKCDGIN